MEDENNEGGVGEGVTDGDETPTEEQTQAVDSAAVDGQATGLPAESPVSENQVVPESEISEPPIVDDAIVEVVEGEIVEGEIVEGEVVDGELLIDDAALAAVLDPSLDAITPTNDEPVLSAESDGVESPDNAMAGGALPLDLDLTSFIEERGGADEGGALGLPPAGSEGDEEVVVDFFERNDGFSSDSAAEFIDFDDNPGRRGSGAAPGPSALSDGGGAADEGSGLLDFDDLPAIGTGSAPTSSTTLLAPEPDSALPASSSATPTTSARGRKDLWEETLRADWQPDDTSLSDLADIDPYAESLLTQLQDEEGGLEQNMSGAMKAVLQAQQFRRQEERPTLIEPVFIGPDDGDAPGAQPTNEETGSDADVGPNETTSGANNVQNHFDPRRVLHELSERRQGEFAAVVASVEREVEEQILEQSEEKTITLTVYHALDEDHAYDAEPPEEEYDGRPEAIDGSEKSVAKFGLSDGQDQVTEEVGRRPLFSGGTALGGLNRSQLDSGDGERPSLASLVEILPDELEVPEARLSGEWSALADGAVQTKPPGMPGAVQFLGSLPHLRGAPPTDGLPVGSMHYALPTVKSDEVIEAPSIARHENEGDGWADRLLRFLWSEMSSETDAERMAALLYAAGRIIAGFKGVGQDASPIFWAACANAPDAHHCRWALHESLRASGQHKALIARWLEESSSRGEIHGYRHGAGYLALERGMTPTEAQAIWDESGDRTELLLSKFLLHSARFEWEGALDLARKASAQAEGPDLWGLFAFTRVRLSMELDDVPQVRALLQRMIDLLGHTPGVSAFVFQSAVELDDLELQLRLGQVNVDYLKEASAGASPDDESELAKALVQLGWVLERLGRHAEALKYFEKALRFNGLGGRYVQRRCVELAQYLGDPHRVRMFMEAAAEGVNSDEERANAYYQMGLVARERLADEALAAQDFRKALSALPSFTPAQRALCRLENRAGRFEEAEASLTRETDALAERLADEQADEGTRRRLYDSLERKYFRLGRMLEERGALEEAVAVYKRAHDLAPDALPPFFALDRIYGHLGHWRPRVELLLKWADATSDDGEAVAQILMEAADGARVHLADPKRAWGLYFRVINGGTPNDYTLWRAGTVLSDFNDHPTRLELEVARARRAGGGWGEHFWRAGVLKERDLAEDASVEAGALYLEGLERAPDHCGLIDGFVRTQASYRSGPALIRSLKQIPAELCESGALSIFLAEHYLAAGAPKEAAELLLHWRARARSRGSSDAQIDLGIAEGLEIALEDLNDWPALADLMEEQALETDGERQVERLVRAGLYWEQSLGEHGLASELYERALALEPGDPIALAALRRLATPDESFLEGASSFLAPKHLSQLKAIARGILPYDGDVNDECGLGHHALSSGAELLWGTGTEARDIAERRLLSESGRLDRKADYERLKLKYGSGQKARELLKSTSDAGDRESMAHSLRQQIGLGFRSGDNRMVREAAERLLALTPNSVPALMALRRLTRASGDRPGLQENTTRLLDVTRSKEAAAELRHAALVDAQARGASEAEISKLLEEAVLLDPTNGSLAKALEEKLRSESKWTDLLGLYDRMLAHLPSPKDRQRILRARGEVLSEEFGDHGEALAGLNKEFEENEPELASALLAARLCERLGRFDGADAYFEQATVTSNESERMEAVRAHCRALFARGETNRSLELIDTILQSEPENVEAWEMVAEILGMRKDWKGVVKALRRLLSYETNDAKKAQRAAAIAEVFAQVFGDARRAAGWYKRAVELAPGELSHLKRLKEQLARVDEDPLAEVHMTDAVERAIAAQREKLRQSPVDVSSLTALFDLYGLSGQADGELVCGQLLSWLGSSNPKIRDRIEFLGARVRSDSPIGLTPDLRAKIVSPDEKGAWARVFSAVNRVIAEVLGASIRQEGTRISRRSFAPWQKDLRGMTEFIGCGEIEVWNLGRRTSELRPALAPHPILSVPEDQLSRRIDPRDAYELARIADGFLGNRLLYELHGVEAIAECVNAMYEGLDYTRQGHETGRLDRVIRERLAQRAKRLPRRHQTVLVDAMSRGPVRAVDLADMATGIERTGQRVGYLCSGDLEACLDVLVFASGGGSEESQSLGGRSAAANTVPGALALVEFALSEECVALRRELGLGVEGGGR